MAGRAVTGGKISAGRTRKPSVRLVACRTEDQAVRMVAVRTEEETCKKDRRQKTKGRVWSWQIHMG